MAYCISVLPPDLSDASDLIVNRTLGRFDWWDEGARPVTAVVRWVRGMNANGSVVPARGADGLACDSNLPCCIQSYSHFSVHKAL